MAEYGLTDKDQNDVNHGDLQDKERWCVTGLNYEKKFVEKYGEILSLHINPNKKYDKYAPDLVNSKNNELAELKTKTTPFFTAEKYNCSPQYAVTFNDKDYRRYLKFYPSLKIYFWVSWVVLGYKHNTKTVQPMEGVWEISFENIHKLINNKKAKLHIYYDRIKDTKGNAKSSYLLDLEWDEFTKLI